jgi:hypothetical protein
LGGIASDFSFEDPWGGFCGQHTATELENGNILLFDNGVICIPDDGRHPEQSRAIEYALDHDTYVATPTWSYTRLDAFATSQGSTQRLPNGNTLISWGFAAPALATEVDRAGNVVFELEAHSAEADTMTYRAQRFAEQ